MSDAPGEAEPVMTILGTSSVVLVALPMVGLCGSSSPATNADVVEEDDEELELESSLRSPTAGGFFCFPFTGFFFGFFSGFLGALLTSTSDTSSELDDDDELLEELELELDSS